MKAQQQIIGGRYQYNPLTPLKENDLYTEYRAYDKVTKRDLVLHILPRDDRLIQILRDVKHPFILLVFDVVVMQEGSVAVLMESGSYATLFEIMENNGFLMEEDALVIVKFLLLALKELHQKLIIYGRVCLQNILFCQFSLIKLGYNSYEEQIPLQLQSPEQLHGHKLSQASDIYSLGVVLYRMVYGVLPFQGLTDKEMLKLIKGKDYSQAYKEGHSPLRLAISKQTSFLIESMLDYHQENRPTIDQILQNSYMNFPIQTDFQAYLKPKVGLLPQPFIKKYLIFRASKMLHKYDAYYQQYSYMSLSVKDKRMVTIYCPQIRMFQTEPRKVQSFYEKLKAIQQNFTEQNCQFLVKLEDVDKFRQQPIFVTQYCNQGDLFNYLQKRKISEGWLKQKQINLLMYIMAIGIKQMRELGVTSIHTIHPQRIMIKDKTIKIREPGLLSPIVQKKLIQGKHVIDYFAPELKQNLQMVQLDKSDMWSYGVLYYYMISNTLPLPNEQGHIDIQSLKTDQKNRNVIAKCLDYSVQTRLQLESVKLQEVDQQLLKLMLKQKHEHEELVKEIQNMKSEVDEDEQVIVKDRKIMFKHRKKPLFKDYNKIIAQSQTSRCRICFKTFIGLFTILIVFFGNFIINGGYGLLRSYYFNPITIQVPYNYGTSLIDMTILTTDGANIEMKYSQYSYEQFTQTLRCANDRYTKQAPGKISEFINGSHTAYCLFGFLYVILFLVLYTIYQSKLDLPVILFERKEKKDNKNLYHFLFLFLVIPSLMFCFFYTFALQYLMQIIPCFGIQNLDYPKFTSIESLLSGDSGAFFSSVFLTVILWALLMFLYGFLTLVVKKFNSKVFEWKVIIPSFAVMLIFTVLCRVGFGGPTPIQPTWTYKMNMDIVIKFYGFFGLFPELLIWLLFVIDRVIDFIFWYFLKRGLQGVGEEDIKHVKIVQARYEPIEQKKLDNDKSNVYMIDHDFQRFD